MCETRCSAKTKAVPVHVLSETFPNSGLKVRDSEEIVHKRLHSVNHGSAHTMPVMRFNCASGAQERAISPHCAG